MSDDENLNGVLDSRFLVVQNWITGKFVFFPSKEITYTEMVSNRTLPLHIGKVHQDHIGEKGFHVGSMQIVGTQMMKFLSSKLKKVKATSAAALPYEYSPVPPTGRYIVFLHIVPRITFLGPTPAWWERFEPPRLTVGYKIEDDKTYSSWSSEHGSDNALNRATYSDSWLSPWIGVSVCIFKSQAYTSRLPETVVNEKTLVTDEFAWSHLHKKAMPLEKSYAPADRVILVTTGTEDDFTEINHFAGKNKASGDCTTFCLTDLLKQFSIHKTCQYVTNSSEMSTAAQDLVGMVRGTRGVPHLCMTLGEDFIENNRHDYRVEVLHQSPDHVFPKSLFRVVVLLSIITRCLDRDTKITMEVPAPDKDSATCPFIDALQQYVLRRSVDFYVATAAKQSQDEDIDDDEQKRKGRKITVTK